MQQYPKVFAALCMGIALVPAAARDAARAATTATANASLCELVDRGGRYDRRIVAVYGVFETDGFENWSLVDPACPTAGVRPAGVFDPAIGSALLEALRHGCLGTLDKRITATWEGVYHWAPARPGQASRWLDVHRIDHLRVARRGGVFCPSRQ
ncbi:MAG: hypothetical protein JO127_03515 [Caulobacteraceae bacterium]|nr:hypothetical protein [Caulobacteraceae bacterium]